MCNRSLAIRGTNLMYVRQFFQSMADPSHSLLHALAACYVLHVSLRFRSKSHVLYACIKVLPESI